MQFIRRLKSASRAIKSQNDDSMKRPLSKHIRRNKEWAASALEKDGFDLGARIERVAPDSISGWEMPDEYAVGEMAEEIEYHKRRGEEWPPDMPLIIVGDNNGSPRVMIDGHHRQAAAIQAGLEAIPVIVIDDGAFQKATMLFGDAPFELFALRSPLIDKNEDLRWQSGEHD